MIFIYSFLLLIAMIVTLPYFIFKMFIDKKYYDSLHLRFGKLPNLTKELLEFEKNTIWIHTVSVGEFLLALPVIKQIKKNFPKTHIVVTTTTKTGNKLAKKKLSTQDTIIYSPIDFGIIVKKFLKTINPKLLIIVETEIWPNLIYQTAKRKIPILLINARISDKSYKNYRIFSFFFKKILKKINLISTRTKEDYERFIKLGANTNQVTVSGNIKFDITPPYTDELNKIKNILPKNKKILVAGSTHEKEEEYIIEAYNYLETNKIPTLLILAPRHPERINKVENLINFYNIPYIKKSVLNQQTTLDKKCSLILVDTIGELHSLYSLADLVFVGGSLIPHGGHNILEPAYFGKAILFGPNMSNFKDIANLFTQQEAAICVQDNKELTEYCFKILVDEKLRNQLGKNAQAITFKNQGSLNKTLEIIGKWLV